ncbi:MAG: hypothetical protein MJ248_02255 [Bacilli bacterium]|nr:hypothetical protein [Bacilli bacterium]
MKKKILILGAVAFMLASCGKSSSGSSGGFPDTTPTNTESTDTTHSHSWGEWSVTTTATCTTAGEETRTCAECGETETRPVEPTGVHTPSEAWSSDENNHWKVCSECECELEKAAHDFVEKSKTLREDKSCYDVVYECSVCGYTYNDTAEYTLTTADILEKLGAAKTKSENKESALKNGEYSYTSYGNTTSGAFEYGTYGGKKAFKQTLTNSSSSSTSYVYYDGDAMCGYKVDNKTGTVSKYGYAAITENDFKGVHYTSGFFAPNYNANIYSIDPIFDNVYQEIVKNSNKDLKLTYADGVYGYDLGVVFKTSYGSTNYYTLKGTVKFDETTGAVIEYRSEYAQYYATDIVPDEELGTFEVAAGKTKDPTVFVYKATTGTRGALELPYTYNDFKFTGFELAYNGAPIADGSTVEVELASALATIQLASRTPETASPDFDAFSFTITDAETGAAVAGNPNYNSYNNSFSLPAAVGKTYNITIKTASGVSRSFALKGKAPSPTSINLNFCKITNGTVQLANFDSKVYIGKPVNITANVMPATADPGYTLTCKDASGTEYTLPKSSGKDYSGKTIEYYVFDMTVAGTYTIEATSTAKAEIKATRTVEVVEAPSLDGVFTGNYYYVNTRGGYIDSKFAFAPDTSTEAVDGTVTVTNNPGSATQKVATFSYVVNAAGDGVECTLVSGECKYYSLRFVTTDAYGINMWFKLSADDTEQQLSLTSESQVPAGML